MAREKTILSRWLRRLGRALLYLLVAALILIAAGYVWYTKRPLPAPVQEQPLFQGITYTRFVQRDPHPLIVHVISIDLDAPGISFLVTPRDDHEGYVYRARTTSQFLDQSDVQLAVNVDFFTPWRDNGIFDYYPHEGDGVNVQGLTVSQGTLVTEGYALVDVPSLYISQDNRVSFEQPIADAYTVISGNLLLLRDGVYAQIDNQDSYLSNPNPRTAVAIDKNGRTLLLFVIDGRQPNYSDGASIPELAQIVARFGGYTALNLDGGGSSTLIAEGADGTPVQLGSAIHNRIPGRERPIANHFGVYAVRFTND